MTENDQLDQVYNFGTVTVHNMNYIGSSTSVPSQAYITAVFSGIKVFLKIFLKRTAGTNNRCYNGAAANLPG